MAITLEKLCIDAKDKYKIQLIAGKDGVYNIVQWVHILEDNRVADFLNGRELVFTTGIGNINDKDVMLSFIKSLIKSEASGLVINIGPYISKIDKEVIEYCDKEKFPLYTCPWDIRLVDVTRGLCEKIINSENNEKSLVSNVKDYIFYPADREKIQAILERGGLSKNINYCIIVVGIDKNEKNTITDNQRLEFYIRREIEKTQSGKYVLFWYERKIVIVTAGMEDEKIKEFAENMIYYSNTRMRIHIAVGSNSDNLNKLDVNFEKVRDIYTMCVKRDKTVMYYDELRIHKILLSVKDKTVLREVVSQTIGSLIEYDKNNNTDYYEFIKIYIKNDGSIKKTAEELFIHRNTVNYKITKIESIINMDITSLDNMLLIKIALEIETL